MTAFSEFNMSLDQWQSFVEECEDGYDWDISEYNNEVRCREKLEELNSSLEGTLIDSSVLVEMQSRLEQLDDRLRILFQSGIELPDRQNWWDRGVLSKAGVLYSDYMKSAYGIIVQKI